MIREDWNDFTEWAMPVLCWGARVTGTIVGLYRGVIKVLPRVVTFVARNLWEAAKRGYRKGRYGQ